MMELHPSRQMPWCPANIVLLALQSSQYYFRFCTGPSLYQAHSTKKALGPILKEMWPPLLLSKLLSLLRTLPSAHALTMAVLTTAPFLRQICTPIQFFPQQQRAASPPLEVQSHSQVSSPFSSSSLPWCSCPSNHELCSPSKRIGQHSSEQWLPHHALLLYVLFEPSACWGKLGIMAPFLTSSCLSIFLHFTDIELSLTVDLEDLEACLTLLSLLSWGICAETCTSIIDNRQ